jgi:hypothetical protein
MSNVRIYLEEKPSDHYVGPIGITIRYRPCETELADMLQRVITDSIKYRFTVENDV